MHEQTLYDATRLMQTLLILIYHVALTSVSYQYLKDTDYSQLIYRI